MICQVFKIYLFIFAVQIVHAHTDRQTGRQTGRRIDRHTDRKTERQIDRQTVRHTDIYIYIYIHTHTHARTHTHTLTHNPWVDTQARPTINYTIPSSFCWHRARWCQRSEIAGAWGGGVRIHLVAMHSMLSLDISNKIIKLAACLHQSIFQREESKRGPENHLQRRKTQRACFVTFDHSYS